jgi:acetyl-CoA decarbonylase/synthase complex subunit delta
MINNIGNEVWKCKEAGLGVDEAPTLGDPEKRPILMEAVAAVCYLMAGSDVAILRHPETVRMVRSYIDLMINGGMASDVKGISKMLDIPDIDLLSLSPEPKLDFGEGEAKPEKKPAKAKKAPAKEAKKAEKKPKKKAEPKKDKEAEAKTKAEDEAKAKAEAEAKAKAEDEARAKAEAEAKAKAEDEAKAKEKAEAKAKESEDLQALRYKRALEREKHEAEKKALEGKEVPKTPAKEQLDLVGRLTKNLDRIHKRA